MFIANLIFLYHIMVASEPLLRFALAETTDPRLREYFAKHLEEERGHSTWLAQDLKSIGVDVGHTEAPLIAIQMAGSIYYLIFHVHPVALLGYMRVLEGPGMSQERLAKLEQEYPRSLLRTVRYHLEHDLDHMKDLNAIIEALPEHRKLIDEVSVMTQNYIQAAAEQIRSAA